jgi:hypothetical protein
MSKRKEGEFNGHKSWNHWNVSQWLNNEEPAYEAMVRFSRYADGAYRMLEWLGGRGAKTPDGAPYSVSNIKAAMRDIEG